MIGVKYNCRPHTFTKIALALENTRRFIHHVHYSGCCKLDALLLYGHHVVSSDEYNISRMPSNDVVPIRLPLKCTSVQRTKLRQLEER